MELMDSLLYGEIVEAHPPNSPGNDSGNRWEYSVKCILPSGHKHIYQHAIFLEHFSGLTDYSQRVVRTSGNYSTQAYYYGVSSNEAENTIGDRCVVAFLSGITTMPIILGLLPHPKSPCVIPSPEIKPEYDDELSEDQVHPCIRTRFNGVEFRVDERGDFYISRYGLPEIKQDSSPFKPASVTFPQNEFVGLNFGKGGTLALTTHQKQQIMMDPNNGTIAIGDSVNFIQSNTEDKVFAIISRGSFETIILENRQTIIKGSDKYTLSKNSTIEIEGKVDFTIDKVLSGEIKKEMEIKISNETSFTAGGNFILKTDKDFTVNASGQTKVEMSNGKIAIGNASVELIDIVTQALNILSTTTAAGYGAPISSVGQFAQLYAKLLPMKK